MIRRIINRIRRPEPSKKALFTPDSAPTFEGGAPITACGHSPRRGMTRLPMPHAKARRRAANKRARAARRVNR